jgi:hypothetical protein
MSDGLQDFERPLTGPHRQEWRRMEALEQGKIFLLGSRES